MEIIVLSIGTLSKNPLWNERTPVRTSHATTTLIRTTTEKEKTAVELLVDPSLPPALAPKLGAYAPHPTRFPS